MTHNFEFGEHKDDEAIFAGDLSPVQERIQFHNMLRFTNIILNSFDTEEEEQEEREE